MGGRDENNCIVILYQGLQPASQLLLDNILQKVVSSSKNSDLGNKTASHLEHAASSSTLARP